MGLYIYYVDKSVLGENTPLVKFTKLHRGILSLLGTLYPIEHSRSLSNRLRTWSHPRRISFLRADCIFAFHFFSSHLEITLLFCLRYFRYCTHAFEVQCFRVLHRAVYRSWCVNSHEPIHGNLELEAVIAAKDFLDLHW